MIKTETKKVWHMSYEEFVKTYSLPIVLPRHALYEVNGVRPFSRKEMWHLRQGEVVYTKIAGWCMLNTYVHATAG